MYSYHIQEQDNKIVTLIETEYKSLPWDSLLTDKHSEEMFLKQTYIKSLWIKFS